MSASHRTGARTTSQAQHAEEARAALTAIERALDAGTYRPGAWSRLVRRLLDSPRAERITLVADVSRVSEKLHRRARRRTLSLGVALSLEVAAFGAGGALIILALRAGSSATAIAGMVPWVTALQPLVKVTAGTALGIRFSHAYLLGIEPRFKMRYGKYVAAPAVARVAFHLAGCVGSPLGAWLAARAVCGSLATACTVSWAVFWIITGVNAVLLLAGIAGARRWIRTPIDLSSGGAAGVEIRRLALRTW